MTFPVDKATDKQLAQSATTYFVDVNYLNVMLLFEFDMENIVMLSMIELWTLFLDHGSPGG